MLAFDHCLSTDCNMQCMIASAEAEGVLLDSWQQWYVRTIRAYGTGSHVWLLHAPMQLADGMPQPFDAATYLYMCRAVACAMSPVTLETKQ